MEFNPYMAAFNPPSPAQAQVAALRGQPNPEMLRLMRQQEEAQRAQEAAMAPPDTSGLADYARQRNQGGNQQLMLALAAQEAGKEFAPMQAHFLKQAAAARDPMKMGGGVLTEAGSFVQDPAHLQGLKIQQAGSRLNAIENAIKSANSAQERAALAQQAADLRRELSKATIDAARINAGVASADRRYAANLAHQDRQAALGAKQTRLTAKEQSDLDSHDAMAAGMAGAVTALEAVPTNEGGYMQGLLQEKIPGGETFTAKMRSPEYKAAIQQLTYVTDAIRNDRFGATLTTAERASAAQYLPSPYDDRDRTLEKAKGLQDLLDKNNQRLRAKGAAAPSAAGQWSVQVEQ